MCCWCLPGNILRRNRGVQTVHILGMCLNKEKISNAGWPGSSVSIATGYGLEGPGIEYWWGRDFPQLSRPALGPTQIPVQWVPNLSRG
jgi:hypothetical protein